MPGTLVRDSLAPVLWNGTTLTATDTSIIDDVEVGYPGWVRVHVDFGVCDFTTGDEVITVTISGSDDGTTYYQLASTQITAATANNQEMWLTLYCPYRYMQAGAVIAGTTPSFIATVKVHEWNYLAERGQKAGL